MRFERKVWLRYSLESGYRKVRGELRDATKDIQENKRAANKIRRELINSILYEAKPEEVPKLRGELQKIEEGVKALQEQYNKVAEPYRERMKKYRDRIKYLDEVIVKDLGSMGLHVRPISLEEAESLLNALKSPEVESEEEVKSDNGGGTGEA